MNFSISACPIRNILWLGLFAFPLSACSSLDALSGESFTLTGELPANFTLKAQAHYSVIEPGCDAGRPFREFTSGIHNQAQPYSFDIPVSYRAGLCEVRLTRVGLFIYGRYGDKDWQQTYDNGGLVIVDRLPEGAPDFQADGSLTKQAECSWMFQVSKLYLELSKLLNCNSAGAYLVRDQLPGKTVRLEFRVNPEEEPAIDKRWIQTQAGWKPCQGTEQSDRCQPIPTFKTFQMNGRECTVYPNCTE